jgi:mycothiol synthase
MTIKEVSPDDRERILTCWNEGADLDPISETLLTENIWEDVDFDPSLALVALEGDRVIGFTVGVVRLGAPVTQNIGSENQRKGFVKMIVVHPGGRRIGVGSALLNRLENVLAEAGCASVRLGESAPNYLMPGLDIRYTPAMLFFENHGYTRFGETYNLSVDLSDSRFETVSTEKTLTEGGLTVRRAEVNDTGVIKNFLAIHWPAWQAEVQACFSNAPISLHLAFDGNALLGFSAYEGNNRGTGWFGPMGTAKEARGRGIGGLLLKRCLADMKSIGFPEAVIPWVGPIGFYSNEVGARISRVFYRYEKQLS